MGKKINLAVFASTKGTDLQGVIDSIRLGELDFVDLKFVLSDKKNAYALTRAREAGYKTVFVDPKGKSREEFDRECLAICQAHEIDLILLIGYMRLLSEPFVRAYKNRIMNIHPSLLPKYPGMDLDVHQAVLSAGETETGCTLHFIDEGVDTGPIILQQKVAVAKDETVESLKAKVQAKEQEVILAGLKMFAEDKIKV
ncbi:MAG: phosphoribosylglycinamide formyltransferase [Candidatus Buchananbacteria bacterium CG10_big_fil_rev_8_21_14_0_10_42_9]|uniref:Phosphoribosylglycinamide formyltransferase n=1 Tax=Candidatus Buchananbacteria bacterium CG10_big_fil_rev_8_21_14_0_10_42_9 TaxID=1974526 RepID=A0A2H0W146_9BACT|nr:MAG: phosphoribosylglycinamide formyltransferase [Candidatus Buchananbacteria bacterium CG10_big_fil_rev_8_21_14_0_10_42_9]